MYVHEHMHRPCSWTYMCVGRVQNVKLIMMELLSFLNFINHFHLRNLIDGGCISYFSKSGTKFSTRCLHDTGVLSRQ